MFPKNLKKKIIFTGICSGVNLSSSEAHDGDASDVCVVRRRVLRDAASESLHCSTSTSSSISAYRSTDDSGPVNEHCCSLASDQNCKIEIYFFFFFFIQSIFVST